MGKSITSRSDLDVALSLFACEAAPRTGSIRYRPAVTNVIVTIVLAGDADGAANPPHRRRSCSDDGHCDRLP